MTRVIFVVEFCHLVTKNKMVVTCSKDFLGKESPKSPYFGGNKN
jgi:hypothetical protein